MRKVKLIIASVAMLGLLSSTAAYADGFAPAEGLYLGAAFGVGVGVVQPKVQTSTTASAPGGGSGTTAGSGIFQATEGGLGLDGIEGGVITGYGYKMGDLYAGIEGEWFASDVEFKLTSDTPIQVDDDNSGTADSDKTYTEVSAKKTWTGGMFGRLGYYINPNTLVSFKGGVLVSEFDVAYVGSASQSETYYAGGPAIGISMDSSLSAIDPNLNLRMGAVYTDFLTASVQGIGTVVGGGGGATSVNSEVTGSALSARVGLTYSFFDVNSLF